jgi:VCBS repeat-containing protein
VPITVNAVNDPPVSTVPGAQSVNEDTTGSIGGVSVADLDSPSLVTMLTVAHGTLSATGAGVAGSGTAMLTISGSAAQINTALAGLSYRGNFNLNGPDTLTVTTGDGVAQDIDTVAITVNPVNDPPALPSPKILRIDEDTTLLIPGVSVSDVDSLSLNTFMEVTDGIINVTAGTGAAVGGNGTERITITGTVSQTNAALAGLSYRGNLDFNGADTLFLVTRDEALERGIPILIIVDPVNDAPANTVPAAQSVSEDTLLPIGGVSVADVDSGPLTNGDQRHAQRDRGRGGERQRHRRRDHHGTAAQINTALTGLSYTGNLNFNGSDTVTVSTTDGALSDTDTIVITVNPVNDAPVNTVPGTQSVNEDGNRSIAGLAIADVDAEAGTLTATLSVAHGTLTVASAGGAGYPAAGPQA